MITSVLYKVKLHEVADDERAFYDLTRIDHITLYLGFVVSGVMDLVSKEGESALFLFRFRHSVVHFRFTCSRPR